MTAVNEINHTDISKTACTNFSKNYTVILNIWSYFIDVKLLYQNNQIKYN